MVDSPLMSIQVTYTPPLREQIRGNHERVEMGTARPVCIFIRSSQEYVMRVDPQTWKVTSDRQQFLRKADDRLVIVPPSQWVDRPDIIEVDNYRF